MTTWTGITHEQFQKFSANVYNEAPFESQNEKNKVASAIVNRKDSHSLGGSWEKTLNRIMFAKDNHEYKMSPERAKPKRGAIARGTKKVALKNVKTANYQDFYNTSIADRSTKMTEPDKRQSTHMKNAVKATIRILSGGSDFVNGADNWRGRGQGKGNRYFKEKK